MAMTMTRIQMSRIMKMAAAAAVDEQQRREEIYLRNIHALRTKIPPRFSLRMSTENSWATTVVLATIWLDGVRRVRRDC